MAMHMEVREEVLAATLATLHIDDPSMAPTGVTTNPHENTTPTCLLSLPGELRNHIWRLVVVCDKALPAFAKAGSLQHRVSVPLLAHISRSVRHEALSIYYSENVFEYEPSGEQRKDRKKVEQWLIAIKPFVGRATSFTVQSRRLDSPRWMPPQWSLACHSEEQGGVTGQNETEYCQCPREKVPRRRRRAEEREHCVETVLKMLHSQGTRNRSDCATVCMDCWLQYTTRDGEVTTGSSELQQAVASPRELNQRSKRDLMMKKLLERRCRLAKS